MILLLALVLVIGKEANGSKRWLEIGGFQFQPSEFMKIVIVIQLASYFSSQEVTPYPSLRRLIAPLIMIAAPLLLILAEPDLGTAIAHLGKSSQTLPEKAHTNSSAPRP
jgi:rod shape determining protein RodA